MRRAAGPVALVQGAPLRLTARRTGHRRTAVTGPQRVQRRDRATVVARDHARRGRRAVASPARRLQRPGRRRRPRRSRRCRRGAGLRRERADRGRARRAARGNAHQPPRRRGRDAVGRGTPSAADQHADRHQHNRAPTGHAAELPPPPRRTVTSTGHSPRLPRRPAHAHPRCTDRNQRRPRRTQRQKHCGDGQPVVGRRSVGAAQGSRLLPARGVRTRPAILPVWFAESGTSPPTRR